MNGSRSEIVTKANGHGAANGVGGIESSRPKPPKLVDELAHAMGMGQETFERPRPAAAAPSSPPSASAVDAQATTLPAMPPPRNFFDDEDDDASMPIPSTWRNPPEPPKVRGLSDQLRATGLGFATGLAIVVPTVLLLTGHLDNSSISQLTNMLPSSMVMGQSQDAPQTNESAPRVQQRAVATTTVTPQVTEPPAIAAAASYVPAPEPVQAAAPIIVAPELPPVAVAPVASTPVAPAPEQAPITAPAPAPVVAVEPPRPPAVVETPPAAAPPATIVEAPPVAAPAPIASLSPAPSTQAPSAPTPTLAPSPASAGNEITEGRDRFRSGDITGGRNVLARAAAGGNAEAIMALAETYDPNMLAAWGIMNAAPDVTTARRLYAKARESGLEIAGARLKGLE